MIELIHQVSAAINRLYDVQTTVEYPGFINIPEKFINDDVDWSRNAWAVGPDGPGEWTGQLMTEDGQVVGDMAFVIRLDSPDPEVIAAAIYTHGIGDWYIGGGCQDADCPCRKHQ